MSGPIQGGGGGGGGTPSQVHVHTSNAHGSTNTKIRRYTTVAVDDGSDIDYLDSATLGATFTIKTAGKYAMTDNEIFNAANWYGISRNSSALNTNISSITPTDRLGSAKTSAANAAGAFSVIMPLEVDDIIRSHTNGGGSSTSPVLSTFRIVGPL